MLHPLVEGSEMRGWALFSVKSYIKSLLSFRCDVLSTSTVSSLASSAVKNSYMKLMQVMQQRNKDTNKNKIKPYINSLVLMRFTVFSYLGSLEPQCCLHTSHFSSFEINPYFQFKLFYH